MNDHTEEALPLTMMHVQVLYPVGTARNEKQQSPDKAVIL